MNLIGQWKKRQGLATAPYYNLLGRSYFNAPGSRHCATRVAVSTRGTETEGHPAAFSQLKTRRTWERPPRRVDQLRLLDRLVNATTPNLIRG